MTSKSSNPVEDKKAVPAKKQSPAKKDNVSDVVAKKIDVGSIVKNKDLVGEVLELDKRQEERLDVFIVQFQDGTKVKVRRYNLELVE